VPQGVPLLLAGEGVIVNPVPLVGGVAGDCDEFQGVVLAEGVVLVGAVGGAVGGVCSPLAPSATCVTSSTAASAGCKLLSEKVAASAAPACCHLSACTEEEVGLLTTACAEGTAVVLAAAPAFGVSAGAVAATRAESTGWAVPAVCMSLSDSPLSWRAKPAPVLAAL
jgi:hypothetical protein